MSLVINGDVQQVCKLLEAVGKARLKFKGLARDTEGQAGNNTFKYMPLGTLVKAVEEALTSEGVGFLQPMHSVNAETCCITTILSGFDSSIVSEVIFDRPRGFKDKYDNANFQKDCQEFGRVSTYQRRYALQSILVLEGDSDADSPWVDAKPQAPEAVEPVKPTKAEENPLDKQTLPAGGAALLKTLNPQASLKDLLYAERDRLKMTPEKLTELCVEITGVKPAATTDEQKQKLLDVLKAIPF